MSDRRLKDVLACYTGYWKDGKKQKLDSTAASTNENQMYAESIVSLANMAQPQWQQHPPMQLPENVAAPAQNESQQLIEAQHKLMQLDGGSSTCRQCHCGAAPSSGCHAPLEKEHFPAGA